MYINFNNCKSWLLAYLTKLDQRELSSIEILLKQRLGLINKVHRPENLYEIVDKTA